MRCEFSYALLKWLGIQYLGQGNATRVLDKKGDDKDVVTSTTLREWIKGAPPPADGVPDDDE